MENEVTVHIIAHGRVQGVFFRATTRDHAKPLGVKGTVKNLPDGTVEIYAQGPKEKVDTLLDRLKQDPGMGEVSHFDIKIPEYAPFFTSFDIVY